MSEETVTIKKTGYDRLLKDSEWLSYLEAAGVNNWSGFDDARQMRRDEERDGSNDG